MSVSVIIPAIFDNIRNISKNLKEEGNILEFITESEKMDNSILDIGMVDDGEEKDHAVLEKYVEFLDKAGIVSFATNVLNGTVLYRTDILGNPLAKIIVTLKISGLIPI